MNGIKLGLKLWSINYNLIEKAEKLINNNFFDYIELMPVPNTDIYPFQKVKVPYVIHITSELYGLNIADKEKNDFNLGIIEECFKWADALRAKYLILHPGFGEIETAKFFLEKIKDKRILIENMPRWGINNEKMVGFNPEQVKILTGHKFGLCLDLNHAAKAAVSLEKDYKKYIKEFLEFGPIMFHISDGKLNQKEKHLNVGEGEYDFKFLLDCVRNNKTKYVTMETPRSNLNSFAEDLENRKILNNLIGLTNN